MIETARLRILALTNLFPSPWDPRRAAFNRQQFERLGRVHDVSVRVAVNFLDRLRGRRGDPGTRIAADCFTFVYPPGFARPLHAAFWYASLMLQGGWRIRRGEYDCLLASWASPDAVAVSWLARRLRVPYVVKVHGSDLNTQAEQPLRRRQIARALQEAHGVIAVSRALAEKAVELGADPARVHTIYNGVDADRFSPGSREEARRRLKLDAGGPIVLYVGNLKLSKGCRDLLDAFPAVLGRHADARLFYVGDGPDRNAVVQRSESLGITDKVRFVGGVPHDALPDWFRAANLLCLPSHNEGVPNVVLEAMACGTPVVATRVGGIPEVLPGDAGLLVEAHAVDALGAALRRALDETWDARSIVAHAGKFRWDDNIRMVEHVLLEAAGRNRDLPVPAHPGFS
jgi:glycosyltransferase involved in cell wall biosynthesis